MHDHHTSPYDAANAETNCRANAFSNEGSDRSTHEHSSTYTASYHRCANTSTDRLQIRELQVLSHRGD
jgi:hypothetical protein